MGIVSLEKLTGIHALGGSLGSITVSSVTGQANLGVTWSRCSLTLVCLPRSPLNNKFYHNAVGYEIVTKSFFVVFSSDTAGLKPFVMLKKRFVYCDLNSCQIVPFWVEVSLMHHSLVG